VPAARSQRSGLVALAVLLTGCAGAPAGRPAPQGAQGRPGATALADRTPAVQAVLDGRAAALLRRDRAAFLSSVDTEQPAYAARQAALFDDLAAVPVASWSYAVDPTGWQPDGAGWSTRVVLAVALTAVDTGPATSDQHLSFVRRGDRWLLGGQDDAAGSPPAVWDEGPVVAVRGTRSLVLGHPSNAPELARLAADVDAAVPRVTAVWGSGWAQRVAVVVPADTAELYRLVRSGPTDSLAAMTVAGRLRDGSRGDDRVVVNPPELARLDAMGRRVVLTHELVHVASGAAAGSRTPAWLSEGLADHVGFLGAGLPVRDVAAELSGDVRAGRVPRDLPADAAFADVAGLSAVYEQAWLAVELLVRTYGQDRVLALYRDVGTRTEQGAVDGALRALGTDLMAFTAAWRADLVRQLS